MRILVTGSTSGLGMALVRRLEPQHEVHTLDTHQAVSPRPMYEGDGRDRELAARVTTDCEAVIHLLPQPLRKQQRKPALPLAAPHTAPWDVLDIATRATYNLITNSPASRFILVSTLRHFECYPPQWAVSENWMPRPTTDVYDLAPYLAEVVLRETARVLPVTAITLRLGEVVEAGDIDGGGPNPGWLHMEDAVQAVERALDFAPTEKEPRVGPWVFHIVGGGKHTRFPLSAASGGLGYVPRHDLAGDRPLPASDDLALPVRNAPARRVIRRVAVFGANGPFGAVAAEVLAPDHILHLTSRRPMDAVIAADEPRNPGDPKPRLPDPPHQFSVADITDLQQVVQVTRGMDAIVNCTVQRTDPVQAFRVNMLGAYNLMQAAVQCEIKRIVHTGPQQLSLWHRPAYSYDFSIVDDAPARPGTVLYAITKLLGQEICRVFAEEYKLEVACLLWGQLRSSEHLKPLAAGGFPFATSWYDTGQAILRAVMVDSYPRPFEVMHVVADLPQGVYTNDKAKRLLGWEPRDRLNTSWTRNYE